MGYYDQQNCYYSGFYTFANDDLSSVSILDLSNTIFAEKQESVTKSSYSAYYTFAAANLSGLSTLNLNNTVFAAPRTDATNAGTVFSASCTFRNANLSGLSSLDLSSAIFCVSDMGNGTVYTAYITF
jgi:hypothetical protein